MISYLQARQSQLRFYRDVPLYAKIAPDEYALYKPSGITIGEMRIKHKKHPKTLYIKNIDKIQGIQESQKAFHVQLKSDYKSRDHIKVKDTLCTIVRETLSEPRSGSLEGFSETVDILLGDYTKNPDVIARLIDLSQTDYSTVLHSINVMAFSMVFASHNGYSKSQARTLGLSGLLHDVGKTQIDRSVLCKPQKLSDDEFSEIKRHTRIGFDILRRCRFPDREISLSALEHHEKLDGSGYPDQKKEISWTSQVIGMIDCYEALTNDDRPYRNAMGPFDTLSKIIKEEVEKGKFRKEIYAQFVRTLGNLSN